MAKFEKILKIVQLIQILKENPNISAKELASLLNMELRTVYRYIESLQQVEMPPGLKIKKKSQHPHPHSYNEIVHLNLALGQSQLSLIHKSIEFILQNSKELNESEIQILEEAEGLISKALLVKPEASPASINFLFEPTKGKSDGEVNIGFVGNLQMSNPHHMVNSISIHFLCLIFSSLFSYSKGKLEGSLVKSWEVSDDLLTWNFDLRAGVKFHNGNELTAEDVAFTYQSLADPEYSYSLSSKYSFVSSFEAISKYKFQIRLKQPSIGLLETLGVCILPKEILQRYRQLKRKSPDPKTLLIGSGPFQFDSFPQTDNMTLKANEDYFEEGYPHLERVILKAYPTSRDLFNAASSGEVDVCLFGLTVSELEQLGKSIPFRIYPIETHAYYALLFNLKDETFSDIRVRKAISHAIDKESLIRKQLRGYGSITNGLLSPLSWAYNENLQPVKYDIKIAKSLLIEAGWQEKEDHWKKGNKKLDMEIAVARDMPDYIKLAIGIKLQLSKLKVKVKLRYINSSEIAPDAFESAILLINGTTDPETILWNFWHSRGRFNFASYQNPEVDELLDCGKKIVSMSGKKALYDRIQELIVSDYPGTFLCTSVCFVGSNCVLQNADEFLRHPDLFLSIKSWAIKR